MLCPPVFSPVDATGAVQVAGNAAASGAIAPKGSKTYFPWNEDEHYEPLVHWALVCKVHKRTTGENLPVKWGKCVAILNERAAFRNTGVVLTAEAAEAKYKKLKDDLKKKGAFTVEGPNLSGLDDPCKWQLDLIGVLQEAHEQQTESKEMSDKKKELNKVLVYREDAILAKDAFTAVKKEKSEAFDISAAEVFTPSSDSSSSSASTTASTKGRKRKHEEYEVVDLDGPIDKLYAKAKENQEKNLEFQNAQIAMMGTLTAAMAKQIELLTALAEKK